ncbi:MAG TPA: sterol desaturase family protein [Candidatus Limnocylindrales bacterium]|nr:sterol desaturase family protein [Candidatus Limnocylindrales bacterium]
MGFICSFILAGFALQLAAAWWPIRVFDDDKEVVLDVVALVVALVTQIAIAAVAFPAISSIQWVPFVSGGYHYLLTLTPLEAGLFYFLVVDFIAYWMHRLNHARWLWSTHAFHHSSRNLYWASGMRGSPVHFLLLGIPSLIVQVFFSPEGYVLWLVLAYGVVHNSLIHSNVRLPRAINWVFVTGESHLVHHARDTKLGNTNFGFLFTFWDRMFGTWTDPASVAPDYPLGLGYEVSPMRLVAGLPPRSASSSRLAAARLQNVAAGD